jgi:hypothetical protein
VLVPTPQSLVSVGIAELAPAMVLDSDAGAALAAVIHDAGIELDLAHPLSVDRALEPSRSAEVNAALTLHQTGASEAEAQVYLERWALMSPNLAAHVIRFLREPTSRTRSPTRPDESSAARTSRASRCASAACSPSNCASATCSRQPTHQRRCRPTADP